MKQTNKQTKQQQQQQQKEEEEEEEEEEEVLKIRTSILKHFTHSNKQKYYKCIHQY